MTQIPDFATIDLDLHDGPAPSAATWEQNFAEQTGASADTFVWNTPEGIDVKCLYTPADLEGDMEHMESFPGFALSCAALTQRCTPISLGL